MAGAATTSTAPHTATRCGLITMALVPSVMITCFQLPANRVPVGVQRRGIDAVGRGGKHRFFQHQVPLGIPRELFVVVPPLAATSAFVLAVLA